MRLKSFLCEYINNELISFSQQKWPPLLNTEIERIKIICRLSCRKASNIDFNRILKFALWYKVETDCNENRTGLAIDFQINDDESKYFANSEWTRCTFLEIWYLAATQQIYNKCIIVEINFLIWLTFFATKYSLIYSFSFECSFHSRDSSTLWNTVELRVSARDLSLNAILFFIKKKIQFHELKSCAILEISLNWRKWFLRI